MVCLGGFWLGILVPIVGGLCGLGAALLLMIVADVTAPQRF